MKLHVHVYPLSDMDAQVADFDVEMFDQQPDLGDGDGYRQFGFERNGEWIEIRVPFVVFS